VSTAWDKPKTAAFKAAFSDFLNHVRIFSKDEIGDIQIKLIGSQKRFLNELFEGLERDIHFFVVLKARQLGLSTIVRILILFWAFMHPGLRIALVYDSKENRDDARKELKSILDFLPATHKVPIAKGGDNEDSLDFVNDARIALLVAGRVKTRVSGSLGRARGINCAGCTEVSSWADIEGLRAFERSLSDEHENRLYVWESTARGPNIFKTIWDEAVADDLTKKAIFIGWWAHDRYIIKESEKPELFKKYGFPASSEELAKIAEVRERYDCEVTLEQLAWYRHKHDPNVDHADDEREGQDIIQQELPWCVVGTTRVGTNCGIIPIREVRAGMFNAFGGISAAGPTGVAQTYEAVTSLGYHIKGTGNHPLAISGGEFVDLKDAQGRQVILSAPMFAENEYVIRWKDGPVDCALRVTPDFARLIGLYMGDGSLSGSPRSGYYFSIACDAKDQDVVIEAVRLIKAVFGLDAKPRMIGSGCADVRVSSKNIFELFKKLGLTRSDTVKTMRRVHVPEFIWRSPKHVVREFLRGLFEADGFNDYKGANRVSFFSKWPSFIEDVQLLLLAFDITCKRTSRKAKTSYIKNGVRREHSYTANEVTLRSN
jgi:DNA-binding transcriptional regulator WhiA